MPRRKAPDDYCTICGCRAPDRKQHEQGRKHLSRRFYGGDGSIVFSIRDLQIEEGPDRPPRRVRPADVPDVHVQAAHAARGLVLPLVVRHSGVQLHQHSCAAFDPEPICEASIRLQDGWPLRWTRAYVALEGTSPATVLCVAERLARMSPGAASSEGPSASAPAAQLRLEIATAEPGGHTEMITGTALDIFAARTSSALEALAASLASVRGPLVRLRLVLDAALRPRWQAALVVKALRASLMQATTLCELDVAARGTGLRQTDVDELVDAARRGWRRRALAFLMGGHARLGAEGPIRLLPGALLQSILEFAEADGATRVTVALHAAPPPAAAAPPPVPGGDLAMIAGML